MKADLAIYSQVLDVSGQCMSVSLMLGIILDFSSVIVPIGTVFVNAVTYGNELSSRAGYNSYSLS